MADGNNDKIQYPFAVYRFSVKVDNQDVVGGFSECSGLTMDNDVIEYRTGAEPTHMRKMPGLRKFTNIVLKRGFTSDNKLYEWRKKVIENGNGEYRSSGSISVLGEDGAEALRWSFTQAWPSKLEGPALNAKNNEVAIESMELVVETLTFEVPPK